MLEIRTLTLGDLEDALRLSAQAGWNQVAADWKRLLGCWPDGCFAGVVDGTLVGTTTVIDYDNANWIGMVLVDEAHRNQGYGSQLFEHGLEHAGERDGVVGLDATHHGKPIYEKYGFERVDTVHRWQGTLREPDETDDERFDEIEVLTDHAIDDLCSFDRASTGTDRGELLRTLLNEPDVRGYHLNGPDGIEGYAIIRPGRTNWQIGPIVTTRSRGIGVLLDALSRTFAGRDVITDAPNREDIASRLSAVGLSRDRELLRMTYPEAKPALLTDSVQGFVDFAFG